MPTPVILVAGTWGEKQADIQWWQARSPFVTMLLADGVTLLSPDDPYRWTTNLDGIIGNNDEWARAGDALRWYANAKLPPVAGMPQRVSIVAHSHGGNLVADACATGLLVDRLITVATPVRWDMRMAYEAARKHVGLWIHLYSDHADIWQWLGSWFDGSWRLRRRMKRADLNLKHPGVAHSALLDPALWRDRRYAFLLSAPDGAVQARVEMIRRGRSLR